MSFGSKYVPLLGVNTDLAYTLLPNNLATFIKNLIYATTDTSDGGKSRGANTGIFKTMQSTKEYEAGFTLPAGTNTHVGSFSSKETRQVFVMVHNSNGDHTVYILNGETQTTSILYQDPILNFQLNPEHYFHFGAANIWVLYIADPLTGEKKKKTFFNFTDGYNPQRTISVEDSVATGGFNSDLFPYFTGDYDKDIFINMGVPAPQDCVQIEYVPLDAESRQLNNKVLFNTWQFRTRDIDVWGRPSEYGIISEISIPGINDCLSLSSNISRCYDLIFDAPSPMIDKKEIAYRNCNSSQWYTADTLDLYDGSPLGEWWLRQRNPDVDYDAGTGKIKYRFCADKECNPIDPTLTNRIQSDQPLTSYGVASVGKSNALSNNKYGFNPYPKSLRDKIHITVEYPDTPDNPLESRNITVYAAIFNPFKGNYQQVFKDGDSGYAWGDNNTKHGGARAYRQYFPNPQQSGFIGYLVGANSAISTQVWRAADNTLIDDENHNGINLSPTHFTLQKWQFTNVPPGVYVFRIASHLSNPNDDINFRNTSTTVGGITPFDLVTYQPNGIIDTTNHEVVIDVCNGDYDTLSAGKMIMIVDVAAHKDVGFGGPDQDTKAISGYLYETKVDGLGQNPVELAEVIGFFPTKLYTDHNGFYWTADWTDRDIVGIQYGISFINKCAKVFVNNQSRQPGMYLQDIYIDSIQGSSYSDYPSTPCNRIEIKGKLTVQGTNIGIPNVDVVLTRGSSTTTNNNGEFTIIAHDDSDKNPRIDQLVFTSGSCRFYNTNTGCITPKDIRIQRCNVCDGVRTINIGETFLQSDSSARGLLSGGTYAVGFAGKDWIDRSQYVQDLGYINIPTVQQTKTFLPSRIHVIIDSDVDFGDRFDQLVFYFSEETTTQQYVTWIVDDFEFVDNTGRENNANPTQIKIYYSSLAEFNKQNNYNTTVDWGFIKPDTADVAYTTDKVYFLVNGDGKFFDESIVSVVKYAKDGQYFLINYTDALKNLKQNAFIRLVRPRDCTINEPMYEVCPSLKIVNGKPSSYDFYITPFDTYYINREIPVPILQEGEEPTFVNETRIFAYPFEHDSPSDFWGKGCKNIGRLNFKNPYEAVLYKQDEIALSGSFSENGFLNFLSFYSEDQKRSFDESLLNGIVSVIFQTGKVLVIGQSNHFTIGFNDNMMRVDANGNVLVPSAADKFGNPYGKVGGDYGCLMWDKNTIYMKDGLAHWLDTVMCGVVQHNYSNAEMISTYSCNAYMRAKIKEVDKYNKDNGKLRYFTGVVNVINGEYILTDRIIGSTSYVNQLRDKDVTVQETLVFDMNTKAFKGWYGFTPEGYAELEGELNDQQLFSFKNGIPYVHYSAISENGFGNFYGVPVGRIIEVVVNEDNLKKKKALSTSVYSHSLYFVDRILTEASQESWIPKEYWTQANFFWSAPLLCDLNTIEDPNRKSATGDNKLTDGDTLYGLWAKVRYVGVPEDNEKYTELTGVSIFVFPEEKSSVE